MATNQNSAGPFTIAILAYGDYQNLAQRCFDSFASPNPKYVSDVRIGLNSPGAQTSKLAQAFAHGVARKGIPCRVYQEISGKNVYKYPLMRRMLYDADNPILSQYVLWSDDDSYIAAHDKERWWADLAKFCAEKQPKVLGAPYTPAKVWTPIEKEAIAMQPWYTGAPCDTKVVFICGGWWVADVSFLKQWDYPFLELKHNGGDVILGELCRQQRVTPQRYKYGMGINADAGGRESRAVRRGATTHRPFEVHPNYTYEHHDFEVRVDLVQ